MDIIISVCLGFWAGVIVMAVVSSGSYDKGFIDGSAATIVPAVPGPKEDNHNITELCYMNGRESGRWEVKTKILSHLMEQKTQVKGVCHAHVVEMIQFVEEC